MAREGQGYPCYQRDMMMMMMMTKVSIINLHIGLVGRVCASGPGDLGSIPGRVIPKAYKMVLDSALFITQQYKVRIKGKVEQVVVVFGEEMFCSHQ